MTPESLDRIVLATVNAPWKRTIDAATLAAVLQERDPGLWLVHAVTLFTEVSPPLVIAFARAHGSTAEDVAAAYTAVKAASGERSTRLESHLAELGKAA